MMKSLRCRILGKDWTVRWENEALSSASQGEMRSSKCEIAVSADGPPTRTQEILLHELFELLKCELALKISHRTLTALATGLHHVLGDNRELLEEVFPPAGASVGKLAIEKGEGE